MKRIRYHLIIFLVLLLLPVITSCSQVSNGEIDFTVGYSYIRSDNGLEDSKLVLVGSYDEWLLISNDKSYLSEIESNYDERYFNRNSLILYTYVRAQSEGTTDITKIVKDDNELTVYAEIIHGIFDANEPGFMIIEVKTRDVEDCNQLEIVEEFI